MGVLSMLKHYRYFENPEGTDLVTKMIATTKYTVTAGILTGIWDSFWLQKHKRIMPQLSNIMYWTVPGLCVGIAFTSIAYMSCNIRKKSDAWDFVNGTLAASVVVHAYFKKPVYTYYFTVPALFCAIHTHFLYANKPLGPVMADKEDRVFQTINKMANWKKYDYSLAGLYPPKPTLIDPYENCVYP